MKKLNDSLKYKKVSEMDLLGSFNESLKDEKFKKLVDKVNIPYEKLCKYRSLLEDAACEYDNCLNCKGLLACKNKVKGHAYLPEVEDGNIKFGYKKCNKQKKFDKENAYLENIYSFDIPEAIKTAKIKDIYTEDKNRFKTIKWLDKFIKSYHKNPNQKGLYLSGSFGSGKTYLISATFNELAKEGVKGAIIFWPEFLVHLKSLFGKDDYQANLDKIKRAPLLLIDDIGSEQTTGWSRDEVLCPILQYRMQESLPTFFTSNLSIDLLQQHLATSSGAIEEVKAGRIIERIKQLTDSEDLISKNYRQ